tara:strand:- start:719 stop:868 length:150 start_codon:yes stop_codon:yes gene_type:complete
LLDGIGQQNFGEEIENSSSLSTLTPTYLFVLVQGEYRRISFVAKVLHLV